MTISDNPRPDEAQRLIPRHGGYRRLRSFRAALAAYDATVLFCDRFIDRRSRTHDQMVQAARSGVRNIEEGSVASATSKKTELKLTNVARASLEELMRDCEDFLRHWQRLYRVLPEFKVVVADMQTFLTDLRLWLDQVELEIRSTPSGSRLEKVRIPGMSPAWPVWRMIRAAFVGKPLWGLLQAATFQSRNCRESARQVLFTTSRNSGWSSGHPGYPCRRADWRQVYTQLGYRVRVGQRWQGQRDRGR